MTPEQRQSLADIMDRISGEMTKLHEDMRDLDATSPNFKLSRERLASAEEALRHAREYLGRAMRDEADVEKRAI